MKKPTILKIALFLLLLLQADIMSSQNLKPFVRQFDKQLKGDILVIGNNILNRRETRSNGQVLTSPNTAYTGTGFNGDFDMRYINIDNGATPGIFSSSSANLTVPNNQAPADPCYRVAYAALYWSATLKGTNRANIEKVKIKVPNTANNTYQDITGTVIHDITTAAAGINPDNTQAYACFADITSLLSPTNPNGTYTVANVTSSEGSNGGTGLSAGWSLFIVYEDSSLPSKAISSFNGFTARAQGGGPNNTVINGFTTIPTGPVQARFAFAALEGDYGYRGDYLQINGATITPPTRPLQGGQNNFFNSSINSLGTAFTDRVPNSTNTLGFDTGVIDIDPSAKIIKNNDTSATITLGTNSDIFIYYFTAFSVDIIAPKVVLKKAVKDINNNDASNKNVTLGEELRYELSFKNEGNDNATSFTIVDQLPINTTFNFPSDIISLPTGMTIPTTAAGNQYVTYNATTRTITFTIPNSYVSVIPTKTPESTIKFRVKVVDDCSKLTDACSNIIRNSAESHYFGQLGSTTTDFGDKSYSTVAGCNLIPQSTNFLVGLDACKNRRQEICTSSMTISASGGYKSYSWSRNASGTPVIGTNQTLSITQPGTYYVYNTANPPCVDLQETITVVDAGGVRTNPVIPYADNKEADGSIIGCEIDGKPLPKIYLCGTNDSRLINTGITGATIVWEKTTCVRPTDLSDRCADERTACAWVSAGANGPTFTANAAGYYRVTINSGGCINTYYFNVYKSDVSATISKKDKLCYKAGNITVQQLTGYEYSLTNVSANTTGGWQDSNSFDIWNAGTYYVNYRLKNVASTCVYKTQQVIISDLNINAKVENPDEQPLCFGSSGSITVSASAGFSAYYFVLYDGATILNQVGPLTDRVYTFSAAPGKYYEVEVYSVDADGKKDCTARAGKYINNPSSEIKPVATTITPLTACGEGKYRISATGGTGPYSYFVDGSTTAQAYSENDNTEQNNIIIVAPAAKTYTIRVVDSKLCESTITFNVPSLPKPTYTVSHTDSACYNSGAQITITLGAGGANGYTMGYSINNGGTYQASPIFSNLQPGTYKVRVKYSITYPVPYWPNTETKECIDPAQDVIISGPTSALVASGGVAELAGCTLSQQGGKLRINNAQGGTAPYQYSFDNGATWQASNEKDVLPGQYILKIRDSKGCEYTIPYDIVLDQKPAEPTIKVEDPVFNCNGSATSTVTVTNGTSANYTYEYYLDGVANTPIGNNVFLNVPSGSHTVSVKYNVTTVSTYSNLLQEDFGKGGYTTTPGINPAYCFEDESTPHPVGYPCGDFNDYQINDGKYAVASTIKTNFGNSWIYAKDHTLPADPLGRFLCVNVGGSAGIGGILYSKPIKDVIVNQPVIISLWAENLIVKTSTSHADPKLTIQLVNNLNGVGGTETIVATTDTSNPWVVPKSEKWEYKELSLNPGAYNNLSFVIRSYSNEFNGNDVLLDDIWVRQIPKSCIATKDFPIVIDSNKAFTAAVTGFKDVKCNGGNDGEITISAQNFKLPYGFDYSLDNGATWINVKSSPVTATGLTSKTYNIQVRFDASATSCVVPLTQIVKAPTAVTITATVTKQPTCTTGATITAVAAGGTPAYQYELRQSNGTTVVTAFQSSGVFNNVPAGTYTVVTRDANSCSSPASTVVTVTSSVPPTATLAASSDLCYDTVNQSTLVVSVTGGTGAITYSLDGQPAQTSNTFTNVGPGTHNIVVTDSNSCTSLINNIVIAPQLLGNATISKTLDCTSASPNATITVNITGGNSAFTYKVKQGTGAYGSSTNVTGTSFVYSAGTADTYTFEITDSKGCVTTVNAIVNPISNPTVTATKVDATCNGASTGSVQLVGAGGSGGYTYLFYSASASPVPTTFIAQSNYTGLAAGNYSYQVMDSKGCKSAVGNITISQPTTLTATATATTFTCNTSNVKQAATVTIAVPTTGTAPYEYSFDGGTTFTSTRTLSVTDNGTNQTISYVVKDAQGCKTGVQTITINRLNPPTNITFSSAAVTCTATTTTVTAVATNGVTPITYSITSPAASVASNTTGVFAGLAAGTYNFRATDANGCYFDKPYTITAVTPIAVVGTKTNDALCKGSATGSGTFTVSGNATVGAYTFTLTAGTLGSGTLTKSGNTLTLSNVSVGTYTVQVTDNATGCSNTASVVIGEPANGLTFTATSSNVNCNNDNSQITVTATGGTPNYTYAAVKSGAAAPTVFDPSNIVTVDTNSAADLVWDVYAKDANGCITKNTITILNDNLPTVTASTNNQCTGSGNSFTIVAVGTGLAPLTYSIDGTAFQPSNTFNVPAGTYTVTVKDKNGCTATAAAALIIYPQLTGVGAVTKELDCTLTPNATITVTISGGKGPFTYTSRKGAGTTSAPSASIAGPTFTFPVTPTNADTYTFVITDANGCQATAVTKVDPISNPTVTAAQTNASCNGAADGSVTLTGAGGSGGFTYSNNATTGFTVNPVFTGLASGSYTFYVKDSKGCSGSVAVTITQPSTLAATVATVPFSCNTANGKVAGTVTINVTTGTGTAPYEYSFNGNGYSSNNVLTLNDNGADQTYTYSVRDAKGCPVTGSGTLLRLNPPTDLTFAAPAVTCTATTTTVALTATNGVGTLQYETIAPSAVIIGKQTSNTFANLAPGSYTFRVTDANGCYYTEPYIVSPVTPISVVGNKTSDALCRGGATGSGTYTVSGNATVGNYTFTLTAGTLGTGTLTKSGNTLTLSNVAAGTYTVQVTDTATGCTNNASIVIGQPAADLAIGTAIATNVSCTNDNSQITITANGGTPNYTYAFAKSPSTVPTSTYGNSATLTVDTNSGADLVWDVYVKDANGCTTKSTVTVILDAMPAITNVTVNNQCTASGSGFTITATATGLAPLTYSIDGTSFQPSNTFTVAAGTYTVSVKDKNGCIASAPAGTVVYPQLTAIGSVTKELDCTASPNATITVTIGGGKSQFTYTVQKGSGTVSAASAPIAGPTFTYTVTPANADTYTFVITDANGCTKSTAVLVSPISNPTVTAVQTNASCNGAADGSVTLTGAGGSGGYTYSNNATTGFTVNPIFTGLAAGSYTFYVKDSKNCSGSVAVTITQPVTLAATVATVPFSCNTANGKVAGTVTINVTAGTGTAPYEYSFNGSGFSSNNVLTLNDNGADQPYTYSVRDTKGCPVTGSGTLLRLNSPTDLTFAAPAVTCTATTTTVTLTATNGVGTLQYETIAPSPVIIAKQTSNTFANLAPGTYMFKVTDANGCYYTESFTVSPVTPITAVASKLSDVLCNGGNTGSIRLTVGGFASTYSYTVNGGTAVTGVSSTTVTLPNLVAGNYAIVVTDEATGCTAPVSMTISQPAAALSATYAAVNGNCSVSTSAVTVTATGGTPVYRYSFVQDGAAVGTYTNSNKANLDPAVNLNWDVYIIDANNCTFKLDITITKDPVPTVTASATGQCFGVGSYTITATPGTGLVAPLSYSINNGASYQPGNTFVITTPGSYTVRIKDGNGCTANSNVVIVDNVLGLTAVSDKNITCSAPTAAQVTLTANGGSAPYTYQSKAAAGAYTAMASNVFNTMTPGSYTFRVTDAKGCIFETATPIIITAPVNPDITNVTSTAILCNNDESASITITIDNTKGQAPFVYNVLNTTTGKDYGTQTSGLAAGSYIITVTDAKGCRDTFPLVIAQPDPIAINYSTTPLKCNGSGITQGTITINFVTGGTPLYDYFVTGINNYNKSITNQSGGSAVFEVVDFGLYQIRVVDQNGCSKIISDVLIAAPPSELAIDVNLTATCAGGSATVKILSAFTGAGPFHFNIYNGPGQVWDPLNPTANGWQDENPANSKSTIFTGLTPGVTYTFIVYDEDTKCYYFQTATDKVPTNSTLTIDNFVPQNRTCTGTNDGNVSFDIKNNYATSVDISYDIINAFTNISTGNTGTRTIAGGATVIINPAATVTPLGVGTYYVLVKETSGSNAGCGVSSINFNIKESPVLLALTASVSKNANCTTASGVITAIATDGTAPYNYQLLLASDPAPTASSTGWATANTFTRDAGSYIAYVKDAYGCIKLAAVTLDKDADPTITAPAAICYTGNPFTITISGTVDPAIVGDATYSVNGSAFQISPNFTFNAPGTYTLVIKDGNGCTATTSYEVKPQLLLNAVLTKELDCTPTPNATITLTATGGYNTLYTYEYSVNGGGYTTMPSNVLSTSVLGNYTFRVTDAKLPLPSCQATATLTLDPIPATVFTTTQTNVSCFGSADGTITVNVTSGVGPYEYQLDGGTFQTSNVFTGLIAGNSYVITVKDAKSCLYPSSPITITQPAALTATSVITAPLVCSTGNLPTKAIVTVTATDGTAPYLYSFDNGVTYTSTNTYEVFAGTTFDVLVKDAHGCTFTLTNGVNIPALNPPTNMDITGTPIWCAPAANTTSTVTISNVVNGVGTLQYEILSPIVVAKQTSATFAGLTADTYLFQVTDANGCTYQESYTISPVTNITVSGALVSNVVCNGETNGAVKFTVANYAGGYTAALTAGTGSLTQTGNTVNVTGLVPGTYTVRVTDAITGCIADASVVVTQPTVLTLALISNVNANCNFGAKVSVLASGGTPTYKYQFVIDGATPNVLDYDTVDNAVLDPTVSTLWDVYAIDTNGCTVKYDLTIGTDALPTIDSSAGLYCYTGGPVPITITGTSVGTPTYSIGNGYQSSPNFVLNAPGNYTFSIKDGNGCVVSSPYTLNQELLLQASLTQDLTCAGSATITLLATQGTKTYAGFEVDFNGGGYVAATSPYTATAAGTYTFRVTDSQGCQAVSIPVIVTPTTTPTATFTQTNVSCIGGNDGSIIVTAADGILPYQYSINGGAFQSSNIFTGLIAGTYNIVIQDAKQCTSVSVTATITEPSALAATATLTQSLTCGTGNATQPAIVTITVTTGTGTAPYQYSFNGGTNYSTTNTFTTYNAGTVTAYVKDANNCIIAVPVTITIPALNPPTNMDITGTPIWCAPAANTTSTVTISNVVNGVGTLQYEILSPIVVAKQTSATFAGLTADTYLFQVTDANGCTYQESYTISPVTNITVSGALVSNVVCNGETNGAVKFTVANYAGGYTAALTAGTGSLTQTGNTVNVTGLVPGTYTVRVTDAITGCIADASVVVTQPTVLTLALISNVNANCNFGAKVSVLASGGTPTYKYQFVIDGATPNVLDYDTVDNAVLDPTVSTLWDVYAIDTNGCTVKYDLTIGTDALPTIDSSAGLYCYTGGPVPITITGTSVGTPTYSIGNGYQSSPNFVLNAPGNYTFSIKDGNGCVVSSPYTLNQELLLQASLTQDLTCAGSATITLLATQGTKTYAGFEVDFNGGGYVAATSPYTATAAGTYTFRVTDSQGCQAVSIPVIVTPTTTPTATFTQTNVSCIGGNDGSIIVTAADGILPYQYSINGGAFQSSNIFTGLIAGTYNIVIQDAKQCTSVSVTATITEPSALAATATLTQSLTCGTGNATQPAIVTITVTTGTGTAPYQYSFNGGTNYSTTNTFTTYNAGTVTAYVKDANNCIIAVPVTITIPALNPPTINTVTGTPIWCTPAANTTSTVTINVSNGVGTLHYEILSPASAITNTSGAANGIFTGLNAGTYLFQVTDANGCKDDASYTVDPLVNITIAGQLVNDVSCNGGANGSVKFDVDNFGTSYTATLIGGPTTGTLTQAGKVVTLTNLPIGNYTVEVVDNVTGCRASASVQVIQPTALTLTQTKNVNANCNSGAQVSVTAAGGTPDYKYAFILGTGTPTAADYTNSNNAVLDPALGLNWRAYVIDSKGCETFIPIVIAVDPLPTAVTANVASQCPSATGEYTFTVNVTSGIAPYEYSIGNGFQTSPIFTVNAAGSYDVTVRDANGCTTTVTAAVTISPALQLDATITALPGCVVTNNGIIRATATGGSATANYRYTLDGGFPISTTPAIFGTVTPGNHVVRVRDVFTGCAVVVNVFVAPATDITGLTLAKTDVTCRGGNNGSITASLTPSGPGVNDNPVYVYKLTGTTALGAAVSLPTVGTQESPIFENLEAGDYTVTVTSGRGCQDSEDVRINQFNLIAVGAPVLVQYGCATGTNTSKYATVTVGTVTGGSGTYTNYEFFRDGVSVQSGPQTVYTETDYLGGNYTVTVLDDAGCSGSTVGSVRINPFISLDAINISNVAITCISNEEITVSVATTGGTPVLLNYNVIGDNGYNQTKTNGNFTGLTIGSYIITVTNPATGCSIQKAHYVSDPNTFEIKANPIVKEVCFGDSNGSVELTFVDNQLIPGNEAGPFQYTITGPVPSNGTTTTAGPITISNLRAGEYTVIAKLVNSPECTVQTIFNIGQPAAQLEVTTTKSDITCVTGNNDGVIYASAKGGWDEDYQYQLVLNGTVLVDYSTEFVFSNLSAGTYTVNVKDGKGCPASAQEILVVPAPITFTATADANVLSCYGDKNGVIRVSPPTGGQGSNYLYTLTVVSNSPVTTVGPQIDPVFDGLPAGRYTVTVTDGFSCTATTTAEIVITEPTLVKPVLVKSRSQTCLTQSELTLSATGGTAPYSYSATEDFATVLGTFASSISFDVPVGTYSYFVRDANGCKSFVTAPVENPALEPLTITVDVSAAVVKCQGDASATIFAEATGGLGDYVYTLLDNNNNVVRPGQSNGTFANLPIGNYVVSVVSHDCSAKSTIIPIIEPPAPLAATPTVTDVTCFGANNGKIVITATGGTGSIQYAISPDLDRFDSKFTFENLAPGPYQIVVKDDNGCSEIIDVTIANGNLLYATLDATSIIPELCGGDNSASFRVDIFGGKAPYFVRLDNETAFVPVNGPDGAHHIFSGLKGGDHKVYVTDSYGCGPMELNVSTPKPVTINPVTTETVYGCETNTTTVEFDDSNNVADLDFSLDNTGVINPDGPIFKDLTPGPHSILVRHTNGCEQRTDVFVIEGFDKLTLTDITLSSKAEVNIIRVQGAGGKKDYVYSFNKLPYDTANPAPFTSSNEYRIYETAVYEVIVRDQNGCEEKISVLGKFIDFCMPNYFTPNGDGRFDEIGPGCGALAYKDLTFDIFDRYGRVVAKYRVGQKWDGKYNGAELPTGDYWYVLKLNDEKDDREFVGHFTLYR